MNKRSPNRKRFWVASWVVLCIVCAVTLGGLYKFYRLASQIYDPTPAPETAQANEAPLSSNSRQYLHYLQNVDNQQTGTIEDMQHGQINPYRSTEQQAHRESQQQSGSPGEQTGQMSRPQSLLPKTFTIRRQASPVKQSKKVETFLLLGVDSRQKGEQARADTILLATVPESGGNVHLLSIPRDTYVKVAGHGNTKINHAMSYGGLPLLKRTVQDFLGVKVDHTMLVDFEGFREVVDKIGGLDLKAEKTMDYEDPTDGTSIHIAQGQKLRTGKMALDYARFRNDAEADTGRMRRQQAVIRAMIQQGGKPDNWGRMLKLAEIVGDHVKTDVPPREWVRLVMSYAYNQPEQVKTLQIQGVNRISDYDQLWYFFVDEGERQRVHGVLEQLRRGNA